MANEHERQLAVSDHFRPQTPITLKVPLAHVCPKDYGQEGDGLSALTHKHRSMMLLFHCQDSVSLLHLRGAGPYRAIAN